MKWPLFEINEVINRNIVSSVVLILFVLVMKILSTNTVKRSKIRSIDLKRKWFAWIRSMSILTFFVGSVIIWASEIQTLAFSLTAIAVAIVLSTKELIICILGSVFKLFSHSFSIGDRIQVGDKRGDVIEQSLFSTTLLEVGQGAASQNYTGRVVTIPNSLFVNHDVINESLDWDYSFHTFKYVVPREADWKKESQKLLAAAKEVCSEFIPEVKKTMSRISRKKMIETPAVEPRINLDFSNEKCVQILVRVPAKTDSKGRIEQQIYQAMHKI